MVESETRGFKELVEAGARGLGIHVGAEAIEMFDEYRRRLLAANEVMNLTSITDDEGMAIKHFVDSLVCLLGPLGARYDSLVDIGSGAGFPGIVLRIMNPGRRTLLVESVGKKVRFLRDVCHHLGLDDIEVVQGRAEDLAHDQAYRERFDLAVARGVAALSPLAEYCLPFVRPGGWFVAMKGPRAEEELADGARAASALGGAAPVVTAVSLPLGHGERRLVSIRKESRGASNYPRKSAAIARAPL